MSKRRNLFKDVKKDSPEIRSSIFREAYKINNFNSCPKKEHKNNEHNPWCLHGLGQEVWFESKNGPGEEEEDHFSVRPKYLGRYSGLRNLGATCYVNSLTQILYHNKIFRNKLYQYRPSHDETGAVIRTLQKVLVDLEYSLHGVIDTTALVTSLQLPTTEQQDVVEFGELLFGLLNNSIPSLQDTCKGKGSYITRCLTCGNVTTRSSDFTDLKLQVQPRNRTLAERIQQLSTVEILEGDNSYHCAQCNMLRRVERCFVVNQYPKTLQLQLLRFNYNTSTMQRTKDTSFVKFNDILTLFNLAGDSGHTSKTYKLSGIIIHVGETTQSGHYIAIIKRGDKWVTFNDDVVLELDKLDLKQYDLSSTRRPGCASGEHCSQSVYMLVYEDGSEEFVSLPIVSPVVLPQSSGSSTEESRITDFFSRTTPASSENTSPNQISTRSTNHAEPGGESSVVVGEKEGEVPPPSDILSATLAENLEFEQLRELLMEQRKDVRSNKEVRVVAMRDACCRMSPENEASFVPLPSDMLKTWIETGIPQKLNPEDNLAQNTTTSTSPSSDEVQLLGETTESCLTKLLCVHNKLPYHKLRQLKYVERDIISQIVDDGTKVLGSEVKFKSENCRGDNAVKTEGCDENNQQNCQVKIEDEVAEGTKTVIAEGVPPEYDLKDAKKVEIQSKSLSLENLMLCEECVASDLRQHLYDLTLEDDFKRIGIVQNKDPEIGWWVVKDDFRNFKKIVRQGGNFNKEINCRHSSLDPDPKRRKLVSFDVKTIVKKYFPEFPAPSYLEEPCQVCTDECDQEKLYISTILLHRRDLQRLLTDGAFPYIPSLTPYVIPSSFIKYVSHYNVFLLTVLSPTYPPSHHMLYPPALLNT
ncbi:hypothetical protein ACHWQZ_G001449 [Mnemiopsis leidyi]